MLNGAIAPANVAAHHIATISTLIGTIATLVAVSDLAPIDVAPADAQ
jgi:hypothetical protein